MKLNVASIFALAVAASTTDVASALKENCIEQAPATVYEAAEMSPQNMDFDMENNVSTVIGIPIDQLARSKINNAINPNT